MNERPSIARDRLDQLEGGAAVRRRHHLAPSARQAATRAGCGAIPIITTLPKRRGAAAA